MVLAEDISETKMKLSELRWRNSPVGKLNWKQTVKSSSQHVFWTVWQQTRLFMLDLVSSSSHFQFVWAMNRENVSPFALGLLSLATFSVSRILSSFMIFLVTTILRLVLIAEEGGDLAGW